jgi:hypothetical protein
VNGDCPNSFEKVLLLDIAQILSLQWILLTERITLPEQISAELVRDQFFE